jgi:hypothetical protein
MSFDAASARALATETLALCDVTNQGSMLRPVSFLRTKAMMINDACTEIDRLNADIAILNTYIAQLFALVPGPAQGKPPYPVLP